MFTYVSISNYASIKTQKAMSKLYLNFVLDKACL